MYEPIHSTWFLKYDKLLLADFNEILIFKLILVIGGWGISCELALRWISLDITCVNNGSGNGNNPLPEPMFNQIYTAIWHQ